MFDIGWSELLILGAVAIIVVGPKDLPALMRTVGQYVGKVRAMAQEFSRQFDEAVQESELQAVRDSVDEISQLNPLSDVEKSIKSVKDEVDDMSSHADLVDDEEEEQTPPSREVIGEGKSEPNAITSPSQEPTTQNLTSNVAAAGKKPEA